MTGIRRDDRGQLDGGGHSLVMATAIVLAVTAIVGLEMYRFSQNIPAGEIDALCGGGCGPALPLEAVLVTLALAGCVVASMRLLARRGRRSQNEGE